MKHRDNSVRFAQWYRIKILWILSAHRSVLCGAWILGFVDISRNLLTGNLEPSCNEVVQNFIDGNGSKGLATFLSDCNGEIVCPCCNDCYDRFGESQNNFCDQNVENPQADSRCDIEQSVNEFYAGAASSILTGRHNEIMSIIRDLNALQAPG